MYRYKELTKPFSDQAQGTVKPLTLVCMWKYQLQLPPLWCTQPDIATLGRPLTETSHALPAGLYIVNVLRLQVACLVGTPPDWNNQRSSNSSFSVHVSLCLSFLQFLIFCVRLPEPRHIGHDICLRIQYFNFWWIILPLPRLLIFAMKILLPYFHQGKFIFSKHIHTTCISSSLLGTLLLEAYKDKPKSKER